MKSAGEFADDVAFTRSESEVRNIIRLAMLEGYKLGCNEAGYWAGKWFHHNAITLDNAQRLSESILALSALKKPEDFQ